MIKTGIQFTYTKSKHGLLTVGDTVGDTVGPVVGDSVGIGGVGPFSDGLFVGDPVVGAFACSSHAGMRQTSHFLSGS